MQEQRASEKSGTDMAVQEGLCPKCEGKMVQRKSKFGPFLGCANYPKCKHIDRM